MTDFIGRSVAGTDYRYQENDDGSAKLIGTTEVAPILNLNGDMKNHNDGYSPTRELRRVASIPFAVMHKWLVEEGWDAMNPDHADKLAQKLNDPDWVYLRTADGVLSLSNGVMR